MALAVVLCFALLEGALSGRRCRKVAGAILQSTASQAAEKGLFENEI
jgi:hypothetical protein